MHLCHLCCDLKGLTCSLGQGFNLRLQFHLGSTVEVPHIYDHHYQNVHISSPGSEAELVKCRLSNRSTPPTNLYVSTTAGLGAIMYLFLVSWPQSFKFPTGLMPKREESKFTALLPKPSYDDVVMAYSETPHASSLSVFFKTLFHPSHCSLLPCLFGLCH